MTKKPFKPTRACPHRVCRPAHTMLGAVGLVTTGEYLFGGFLSIMFLMPLVAVGVVAVRAVHGGKTLTEITAEEIASRSSHLIVRRGWARVAATCDVTGLILGAFVSATRLSQPTGSTLPTSPSDTILAICFTALLIGFVEHAHRKATRPAKPKRAPVPVPVQSG